MFIISSWLMVLSSSTMCLLIFCLLDLSIFDRDVLKFPMIIVDSSISPLGSISFCLTWFGSIVRHMCVHLHSVVFNSWWPQGLQPTRLLCPWSFPGKNTGVGCHFLLHIHIKNYYDFLEYWTLCYYVMALIISFFFFFFWWLPFLIIVILITCINQNS